MSADTGKGTTAVLAEWAAGFRLEDAPDAVVDRTKALVLDLLRVVAVGVRMPWSRAARRLALELGGKGSTAPSCCAAITWTPPARPSSMAPTPTPVVWTTPTSVRCITPALPYCRRSSQWPSKRMQTAGHCWRPPSAAT